VLKNTANVLHDVSVVQCPVSVDLALEIVQLRNSINKTFGVNVPLKVIADARTPTYVGVEMAKVAPSRGRATIIRAQLFSPLIARIASASPEKT